MADAPRDNAFDARAGVASGGAVPYGDFVDWDKRLEREGPFFRRLFEAHGVSSVVDVGSGSARHSILFASWGIDVLAVDPSESMQAEARDNLARFAEEIEAGGGSVTLVEAGFGELRAHAIGPADAVVCTGNALPHVDGVEGLRGALEDFSAVLRPGGALVLHLLNHTRMATERSRAITPKIRDTADGLRVFLRVIDYPEDGAGFDFDFVTLTRDRAGSWSLDSRRSTHTALPHTLLVDELAAAGFGDIELLGDHNGRVLDPAEDESVIVVARRR